MMCYKDQTWCIQFLTGICKNKECSLALTEQEQDKAIKWWGNENFPVMLGDRKTEDCGYVG